MKIKRTLILVLLALLVISGGIVAAGSSDNFILERFVMTGGSSADSTSYAVTSVFGQPATGIYSSGSYEVTAGFLQPSQGYKVWVPVVMK